MTGQTDKEHLYVIDVRTIEDKNGDVGLIRGQVLSSSDPSKFYNPSINISEGKAYCDCRAGTYGTPCRHLRGLLKYLERKPDYDFYNLIIDVLYTYRQHG